ncbi:hypothetical protein FKP32DRAFT_1602683 [Trametes sanguinea]|nr:hypothetical protein FKP32DRAFT_1602683 [Trametes sanguinea]
MEFPDPIFATGLLETFGLLHVADFVLWEQTVQESGFDIDLEEFPVERSGEMEEQTERLHAHSRGSGAVVVLAPDRFIASADPARFKASGIAKFVALEPEYGLTVHNATAVWHSATWYELVDTHLADGRELLLESGSPFGGERASEGITEAGRVTVVIMIELKGGRERNVKVGERSESGVSARGRGSGARLANTSCTRAAFGNSTLEVGDVWEAFSKSAALGRSRGRRRRGSAGRRGSR